MKIIETTLVSFILLAIFIMVIVFLPYYLVHIWIKIIRLRMGAR